MEFQRPITEDTKLHIFNHKTYYDYMKQYVKVSILDPFNTEIWSNFMA